LLPGQKILSYKLSIFFIYLKILTYIGILCDIIKML